MAKWRERNRNNFNPGIRTTGITRGQWNNKLARGYSNDLNFSYATRTINKIYIIAHNTRITFAFYFQPDKHDYEQFSFSLTFRVHVVREGQHARDTAQLRHAGHVSTVRGRPVRIEEMQDITGKNTTGGVRCVYYD